MTHQQPVDLLIEEVRRRRRDLLAACGDDLDALVELIRQREAEHPERVMDPVTRMATDRRTKE